MMHILSAAAVTLIGATLLQHPVFAQEPAPAEFFVKAPDGKKFQLRAGASESAGTGGMPQLEDGVSVLNIGCKKGPGPRWCLVHHEATGAIGWAETGNWEAVPAPVMGPASGEPLTEEGMSKICRAEVEKASAAIPVRVDLLPSKPELGGFTIDGTAIEQGSFKFSGFKCLFDGERRFAGVFG